MRVRPGRFSEAIVQYPGSLRKSSHIFDYAIPRYQELKAKGVGTGSHVSADGSKRGGVPFAMGALHHLLSNPISIGKVQHRRLLHQGQHVAIIDQQPWDAVPSR